MCCLFGLIDTKHALSGREKSKILHILASESEVRGTDATGIAYNLGGRLYIHKRPVPGHKLQFRIREDTVTVMGHTRMATQGKASRNRNNHPFFGLAGSTPFALAHNGVLYNDIHLRSSRNLPKTRIETDSYVAVQLLEQRKTLNLNSLRSMAEQVEGSFTFTVLDGSESLFIVKGDSPMCLYWFQELGLYLYNSTEEILSQALQRISISLGAHTRISLNCGEILKITPTGEMVRGEFDNPALFYSQLWLPYPRPVRYGCGKEASRTTPNSYLDEIKSVAMAFGYAPEEIEHLSKMGFTPEELEEMLYCGEL